MYRWDRYNKRGENFPPIDESHSGIQNLVVNWQQIIKIARETPQGRKRGRMKQLMDDYVEELQV